MLQYKTKIRTEHPRIYGQDLINSLFRYPYTTIATIMRDLSVSRITATKYLNILVTMDLRSMVKLGRKNFYLNETPFAVIKDGVD